MTVSLDDLALEVCVEGRIGGPCRVWCSSGFFVEVGGSWMEV